MVWNFCVAVLLGAAMLWWPPRAVLVWNRVRRKTDDAIDQHIPGMRGGRGKESW